MPITHRSKKQPAQYLIVIDANALIHRAFHALPPLSDPQGHTVNAVYGFLLIFLRLLKELRPAYIVAAFDLAEPTFRHQEYAAYKATRTKQPQELYDQIPIVKEFLRILHVPVLEASGFEADDIIGTIVQQTHLLSHVLTYIVTGDLDTLQLVQQNVLIYTLRKGMSDIAVYDRAAVEERYSLEPAQITDLKGLKGDPSDNIPGVPGVGEKTAIALLRAYHTVEELYHNIDQEDFVLQLNGKPQAALQKKLIAHKDEAFFSKYLASIRLDAPIDFQLDRAKFSGIDREQLEQKLRQFGFSSLLRRVGEFSGESAPEKPIMQSEKKQSEAQPRQAALMSTADTRQQEIDEAFRQHILSPELYAIETQLLVVVQRMERQGVAVDAAKIIAIKKELSAGIAEFERKITALAGEEFNINSSQQLSHILFDVLGISSQGLRKTPGKVISTAAPELEKIAHAHPIVPLILEYRELAKLLSTYTDSLLGLIGRDGRIHTVYNTLGAATGRFSSHNPNLQNIPTRGKWGEVIRSAFIAPAGKKMVSFDYSQIELRIAAHLSGDEKLIESFIQGRDIHATTASNIFNVPLDQVTAEQRSQAKTFNFGILYGIGVKGFSEAAHISREQAKTFIAEYRHDFPRLVEYLEETRRFAVRNGYVETMFGRRRNIPEIRATSPLLRAAAERMAINMPIQGTAADILKIAMVHIDEQLHLAHRTDVKMILQVHDELIFEVNDTIIQQVVPHILSAMEHAAALRVPLKADMHIGDNWGEL